MRTRTLLLSAVLAATPLVAVATPAQAAGSMTLWVDDNYKEGSLTRSSYDSNFDNDPCSIADCGLYDIGAAYGDDFSSYKNNSASWWKLYKDDNYRGYTLCVRPYGYDPDLGDSTPMDDEITSIKRFGSTRPTGCDQVVG